MVGGSTVNLLTKCIQKHLKWKDEFNYNWTKTDLTLGGYLKEDKICMQIIIILSRARYGIEKAGWLVRFEFQGQLGSEQRVIPSVFHSAIFWSPSINMYTHPSPH